MEKSEDLWNRFLNANADYAAGKIPFYKRQEALEAFRKEFCKSEIDKNGRK